MKKLFFAGLLLAVMLLLADCAGLKKEDLQPVRCDKNDLLVHEDIIKTIKYFDPTQEINVVAAPDEVIRRWITEEKVTLPEDGKYRLIREKAKKTGMFFRIKNFCGQTEERRLAQFSIERATGNITSEIKTGDKIAGIPPWIRTAEPLKPAETTPGFVSQAMYVELKTAHDQQTKEYLDIFLSLQKDIDSLRLALFKAGHTPVDYAITAKKIGPSHDRYLNVSDKDAKDTRYIVSWNIQAFGQVHHLIQYYDDEPKNFIIVQVKPGDNIAILDSRIGSKFQFSFWDEQNGADILHLSPFSQTAVTLYGLKITPRFKGKSIAANEFCLQIIKYKGSMPSLQKAVSIQEIYDFQPTTYQELLEEGIIKKRHKVPKGYKKPSYEGVITNQAGQTELVR